MYFKSFDIVHICNVNGVQGISKMRMLISSSTSKTETQRVNPRFVLMGTPEIGVPESILGFY